MRQRGLVGNPFACIFVKRTERILHVSRFAAIRAVKGSYDGVCVHVVIEVAEQIVLPVACMGVVNGYVAVRFGLFVNVVVRRAVCVGQGKQTRAVRLNALQGKGNPRRRPSTYVAFFAVVGLYKIAADDLQESVAVKSCGVDFAIVYETDGIAVVNHFVRTACAAYRCSGGYGAVVVARASVFRLRERPVAFAVECVGFVHVRRLRPNAFEIIVVVHGGCGKACRKGFVYEINIVVKAYYAVFHFATEIVIHITVKVEVGVCRFVVGYDFAVVISSEARAVYVNVRAVVSVVRFLEGKPIRITQDTVFAEFQSKRFVVFRGREVVRADDGGYLFKTNVKGYVAHRHIAVGYAKRAFCIEEIPKRAVAVCRRVVSIVVRQAATFQEGTHSRVGVGRLRLRVEISKRGFRYAFHGERLSVGYVLQRECKGGRAFRCRIVNGGELIFGKYPVVPRPTERFRKVILVGKVDVVQAVFVPSNILLRSSGSVACGVAVTYCVVDKGEVVARRGKRVCFAVEEAVVRDGIVFGIANQTACASKFIFVRPSRIVLLNFTRSEYRTRCIAVAHNRISAHRTYEPATTKRATHVAKRVGVMYGSYGNGGVVARHIANQTARAKHFTAEHANIQIGVAVGDIRSEVIIVFGGVERLLIPDKATHVREVIFVRRHVDFPIGCATKVHICAYTVADKPAAGNRFAVFRVV